MTKARRDAAGTRPEIEEMRSGGLALGALDKIFGFHLRMAQAVVYRDFVESLGELAITQKQFAVLALVDANPGASQVEIAETLGTDRATMMALVDRLDQRGWIERQVAATDRRRQALFLTEAGKAIHARALELVLAHETRLMTGIPAEERSACLSLLRRLHSAPASHPA